MFSVRIVATDHYQAAPLQGLDVCRSDFGHCDVNRVPVIRVFGSTPAGMSGLGCCQQRTKYCWGNGTSNKAVFFKHIGFEGLDSVTMASYIKVYTKFLDMSHSLCHGPFTAFCVHLHLWTIGLCILAVSASLCQGPFTAFYVKSLLLWPMASAF